MIADMKSLVITLLLGSIALLALGCGATKEEGPKTSLLFIYKENDQARETKKRVVCDSANDCSGQGLVGLLGGVSWQETPGATPCTMIYGGPATLRVRGTLNGKQISTSFSRENGCEIERWGTIEPLLDKLGLQKTKSTSLLR